MAIRRKTVIEYDTAVDQTRSTGAPGLRSPEVTDVFVSDDKATTVPTSQGFEGQGEKENVDVLCRQSGKTPADVVYAFCRHKQLMAVVFFFLAVFIFKDRVQKIDDLWLPIVVCAVGSIIWYGIPALGGLFTKKR
jgi:hypothetical protein